MCFVEKGVVIESEDTTSNAVTVECSTISTRSEAVNFQIQEHRNLPKLETKDIGRNWMQHKNHAHNNSKMNYHCGSPILVGLSNVAYTPLPLTHKLQHLIS